MSGEVIIRDCDHGNRTIKENPDLARLILTKKIEIAEIFFGILEKQGVDTISLKGQNRGKFSTSHTKPIGYEFTIHDGPKTWTVKKRSNLRLFERLISVGKFEDMAQARDRVMQGRVYDFDTKQFVIPENSTRD